MGMFDYVTVPVEAQVCPACGAKVNDFQSKDGLCQMDEPVSWTGCNRFYTSCSNCSAWIEYRRTPRPPPASLAEFECKVTTKAQLDAERDAMIKAVEDKKGRV